MRSVVGIARPLRVRGLGNDSVIEELVTDNDSGLKKCFIASLSIMSKHKDLVTPLLACDEAFLQF